MVPRCLDRSGGEAGGESGGEQNATRKCGGGGGCGTPPVHLSPSLFGFVVLDRTTRTAPAARGETGATPPF